MAFNSPSPKYPILYKSKLEEIGRIGPGSYNILNKDRLGHGSEFMFRSKVERQLKQVNESLIGPGDYNVNTAFQKVLVKKISPCKSSFASKIERFPAPKQKPKQEDEQAQQNMYDLLLDQPADNIKRGKLYGITRQNNTICQTIPSIPSGEQSYGYRVDQKTKKLVRNQNPNVLLARKTLLSSFDSKIFTISDSIYNGSGSFLLKQSQNIKGPKWHKESSRNRQTQSERNDAQDLLRQITNSTNNSPPKKWQQLGNSIVNRDKRFKYDRIDKRKQLLINSMKQKYFQFLKEEENIEQILRKRIENHHDNTFLQ